MQIIKYRLSFIVTACLVLVACGAKFLPPLWSVTFDVAEKNDRGLPSAIRELPDGSVRIVYHRDAATLVVETYNATGERIQRHEFPHQWVQSSGGDAQKPLFISDTEFYWFDDTYAHSVRVNLESMTVTSLPEIESLPTGNHFGIRGSALLDNGQLVLVGGDYSGELAYQTSHARLIVLSGDDVVLSHTDESLPFYNRLLPVNGTGDFYIQTRYISSPDVKRAYFVNDSTVTEVPELGSSTLMYADADGLWTKDYANGVTTLRHISDSPELNWQQELRSVGEVVPTSDGHYLLIEAPLEAGKLCKLDVAGNTLWESEIRKKESVLKYQERNGRILLTTLYGDARSDVQTDDSSTPPVLQPVLRYNLAARYSLLDGLTGQTQARFAEADYSTLFLWNPSTGNLLEVLDFLPGACDVSDTVLQEGGDFYSVTHWCSDQLLLARQQHLSFFSAPAQ